MSPLLFLEGDFDTCLSEMDRSSRQKISKGTTELEAHWSTGHNWQLQATSSNNSILNIILKLTWDIHQYIFTFWAIKCNSTSLKELKSHNVCSTIKLEIKNRKIAGKSPNTWRLNNTFLCNTWVKEGLSREILKYFQLDGSLRRAS